EGRGDGEVRGRMTNWGGGRGGDGRVNSLGAKLVQLTMPGVADVYQGCELAGFALVDPDNRRLVDFTPRRQLLAALDAGSPAAGRPDAGPDQGGRPAPARVDALDADKLLVTSAALRPRRDRPDWFGGDYQPLSAEGPAAEHAVSFLRGSPSGGTVTVVTRLPGALRQRGGWAGTVLPLPAGPWRDVLTGTIHDGPRPLLST